jgi:hypothetical protein
VELSVAAQRELGRVFVETLVEEVAQVGEGADLFSRLEGAVEATVRRVGAAALTRVVAECGTGYEGASRPCACGGTQTTDHYATYQPQTVVGPVTVRRAVYRCGTCGQTAYPLASRLTLPAARTSPLLQARLSLCCALVPFAEAARVLAELTGVEVSPKRAQLVSEALGTRHEAAERQTARAGPRVPPARLYLAVDGVMYCTVERDAQGALLWREAKVGVLSTPLPRGAPGARRHSCLAPTGPPLDVAASDSHSYVVHLGDWSEFAGKVWQEGQRRGLEQATEIVVVGDGALWITSLVATILAALPGRVTQILDIRHADMPRNISGRWPASVSATRRWLGFRDRWRICARGGCLHWWRPSAPCPPPPRTPPNSAPPQPPTLKTARPRWPIRPFAPRVTKSAVAWPRALANA